MATGSTPNWHKPCSKSRFGCARWQSLLIISTTSCKIFATECFWAMPFRSNLSQSDAALAVFCVEIQMDFNCSVLNASNRLSNTVMKLALFLLEDLLLNTRYVFSFYTRRLLLENPYHILAIEQLSPSGCFCPLA